LVICTALYVVVGFVLTGIVPYDRLDVPDPIAVGIDAIGMGWLAPIVKLGAILGLTSVVLVSLLGQPRIFYSIARDCPLPPPGAPGVFAPLISPRSSPALSARWRRDCCRSVSSARL